MVVADCVFSGNDADKGGGISFINLDNGAPLQLVNCLLYENDAAADGGAVWIGGGSSTGSPPIIVEQSVLECYNCTIADNTADQGGGVWVNGTGSYQGDATFYNSILWGNAASSSYDQINGATYVNYSCIEGGWALGTGKITTDPRFLDAANDDYRVEAGSPTVDAGDNSSLLADLLDLDGDANTTEDTPYDLDDEDRRIDSPRSDTGSGTSPIVDMGVYEVDCVADMDRNKALNLDDVDAFTDAYNAQETAADLDGDGDWDMDDVDAFTTSYNGGCGY